MIILHPPFEQAWKDKDPFVEMEKLGGESYRSVKTRETTRFDFMGKSFFIKRHYGTSVKEIVKNLLTLKCPVIGATQEWEAIQHLERYGVNTMNGVAFGKEGLNPLTQKSFIITEDLSPATSLDEFFASETGKNLPSQVRLAIIEKLATMVREMHKSGLNHRDCYLCHFLLKTPLNPTEEIKISVIDLHRAQIREKIPLRWRDKDLIALYYSSLELDFSEEEMNKFLEVYFEKPLEKVLIEEKSLIEKARKKVKKFMRTH